MLIRITTGVVAALAPAQAMAFNFGFVRAPDWMDKYFSILVPIRAVFFVLTYLTKPSNVPVNELYRTQKTGQNKLAYWCMTIVFVVIMVLLFVGMGLRRAGEG